MTLHCYCKMISDKYIVCIGNSDFAIRYNESYVIFTVNFQVNDCRQIPIVIPTSDELRIFELLFDKAIKITTNSNSSEIECELSKIQIQLNELVRNLYGI
jgi:hypothetical protein